MTENEAIKDIKRQLLEIDSEDADITLSTESLKMAIQALEKQSMVNEILNELREYSAIGTIEELKALKEKRKMKPLKAYDEEREANWCSCPNCTKGIGWEYERHFNFCNNCGTELDWSE